jgi:hypothetical protein
LASEPRAARGAVTAAVATVALLAVGCGGSHTAGAARTSASRDALAYSRCMRAHGVPRYPDPSRGNELPSGLPKVGYRQLGVSSFEFAAAESACARVLPNGGRSSTAASQQLLSQMVSFSRCMRRGGVTGWPDPEIGPGGKPGFDLIGIRPPVDTESTRFQQVLRACGHLVPHALGGIPVRQP